MTTMTKSEFASHINVKPGYVTQLRAAGRLVMDGDQVVVEDSIKLIAETRDPSKAGVAARHETAREEKRTSAMLSTGASASHSTSAPAAPGPSAVESNHALSGAEADDIGHAAGSAYQHAKAFREKYNALTAKMAYEREMKTLLPADDVRQAIMDGDTIIRSRLESLPDQLAPLLAAEMDEQRVRAILIEQIEHLLTDLSSSFHKLVNP